MDAVGLNESISYTTSVMREARPPTTGSECATGDADGISTMERDDEDKESTAGKEVRRERSRGGGVVEGLPPLSNAGEGESGWCGRRGPWRE